jgi:hypothetical protein
MAIGQATAEGAPAGLPRRDRAALPAATLGPKATLIHARRRQRGEIASTDAGTRRIATDNCSLSYVVQPVGSALYVERRQRRPLGADVLQSMVFTSVDEFQRWCDAEPVRFDDPVLHRQLCRCGEEFFGFGR